MNVALLLAAASALAVVACTGPNFTSCESDACEANEGGEAGVPSSPNPSGSGGMLGSAGEGGAPSGNDAGSAGSGESGVAGEQTGGAPGIGQSGAAGEGGDEGLAAGQGGAATPTSCSEHDDCSDGDATDGEERCVEDVCVAGNPPPAVVSVSPERSAMDQEPDAPVVLIFSEELEPASIDATTLIVEANGRRVPGSVAYAGVTAIFTPKQRLPLRGLVTVKVASSVTDLDGATMLDDFSSGFWVRDGAWTMAVPLDTAKPYRAGRRVPIDAAGNVLTTFVRQGSYPDQRAFSRFYHPGIGLSTFVEHTSDVGPQSVTITAALNESGVGAVMWRQSGQYGYGTYSRTYHDRQWSEIPYPRSFEGNCVATGVSPTDEVHFCYGMLARYLTRCPLEGACTRGDLTPGETMEDIPPIAFDPAGNAVAVWRREGTAQATAQGPGGVLAANYSAETQHWTEALAIQNAYQAETSAGGEPNVAIAPDGTALATWVEQGPLDPESTVTVPPRVLLASYFTPELGWADALPLSLDLGDIGYFAPGIAFDGTGFVVAWTALESGSARVYTRRFNGDDWEPSVRRDPAGSYPRKVMPQLASDASGDLVLSWLEGTNLAAEHRIAYRRCNAGAWSSTAYIEELVVNAQVEDWNQDPAVQLGIGPTGVAALLWEQRNGTSLERLWLAVFE